MRDAVPDLDDRLSRGDTGPAVSWLRENLQTHGGLFRPRGVIERACGTPPSEAPLLAYLEDKFGDLYRL
jgi:carboxypeptidase Taq